VRVLTDADMQLEGYALNPADADATPQLVSRQPWPPAWSDAPGWLAGGSAARWADPARPKESVAVVRAGPRARTMAWEPLARNAPDASLPTSDAPTAATLASESNAVSGEPGAAAFNPYATPDGHRADAAADSEATASIALVIAAAALAVAVAVAFAFVLLRRRKPVGVQGPTG